MITTYALCGFSNFVSLGMMLAVLGSVAPGRKGDAAEMALRALVAGNIACFMTACVAGGSGHSYIRLQLIIMCRTDQHVGKAETQAKLIFFVFFFIFFFFSDNVALLSRCSLTGSFSMWQVLNSVTTSLACQVLCLYLHFVKLASFFQSVQ